MRSSTRLLLLVTCIASVNAFGQAILPIAGGRVDDQHAATSAALGYPQDVEVDSAGNLYIADGLNHRIRRVDAVTGIFTTVAGNGSAAFSGDGGPATSAALKDPAGIALDASGNLYIADSGNNRIRRVDAATKIITTVAGDGTSAFAGDGGPATAAGLSFPSGVAVDVSGNLYIADTGNSSIRKVLGTTKIISTIVGSADLDNPFGVVVAASGNIYIPDTNNSRVLKLDAATQKLTLVAGASFGFSGDGGPASASALKVPIGMAVDAAENLYIADSFNNRIRRVDATTGIINTIAGTGQGGFIGDGAAATSANIDDPNGVAVDAAGNVYIADSNNNRVRKIDATTKKMTTVSGGPLGDGGLPTNAQLVFPSGTAVDAAGNVYIADARDARVRRIDAAAGTIDTVATLGYPAAVVVDAAGNLYVADRRFFQVFKVNAATKAVTAFAGSGFPGFSGDDGPATSAGLSIGLPGGLAIDAGGTVFIADTFDNRIRRVDGTTGIITTIAGGASAGFSGDLGPATSASLNGPSGISLDGAGNLYIADTANDRIRRVDSATHIISTVAGGANGFAGDGGPATAAQLNAPEGVAVDAAGNIYIADTGNNRIRKIDAATKVITTIAGNGQPAFSGDFNSATAASLNAPAAVSVDSAGNVYVSDAGNNRVRMIAAPHPRRRSVRRR